MATVAFHEMGLDDRLLESIAKMGWKEPTLIQERAIPLILDGKDLLARGRTGSGKTGAFCIPVLQKVLSFKETAQVQAVRALLLAPSRELSRQIYQVVLKLSSVCGRVIRCIDLAADLGKDFISAQKSLLVDSPDIVVGTPSRVLTHLQAGHFKLKESLEMLVIDEADLIFSYGYESDLKGILSHLPSIFQSILTSATLNDDVNRLKKLVLHNPVTLKLEEAQLPEASQLTQYHIKIEEEDKFVLIYALFKLKLIQGKTIIFVNNVDRCYKLKLYLEQFSIPVCVLNSELPVASRCHIVSQFNQGIYEVIVASDEKFLEDSETNENVDRSKSKRVKDKESGISRGIDFQFISNVINFDFPYDIDSYIHRVGRTARGNNTGTALSMIATKEMPRLEEIEEELKIKMSSSQTVFVPYKFKMDELDGFRYRARDAWRSVTKIAIREARLKELRQEMLNSSKLKTYFEDNPKDAEVLRHDKALHTVKHQAHLKNVPEYIIPKTLRKMRGFRRNDADGRPRFKKPSEAKKKFDKRQLDPLLSMVNSKKKKR